MSSVVNEDEKSRKYILFAILEYLSLYMSKKHSYSSEYKKNIVASLTIISVFSAIILNTLFNNAIKDYKIESIAQNYAWIISPITLPGFYGLYFWIFNNFLWHRRPGCSNLNGIWLGVTMSSSQTWPHYSVMKVVQNWSEISITITVFCIDFPNEDWTSKGKILGIDNSVSVHLSDYLNSEADLIINYSHDGYRQPTIIDNEVVRYSQPNFPGTICLKAFFKKSKCTLSGYLYTNKFNAYTQKWGTNGKLRFMRIKTDLVDPIDILKDSVKKGQYKILEKDLENL